MVCVSGGLSVLLEGTGVPTGLRSRLVHFQKNYIWGDQETSGSVGFGGRKENTDLETRRRLKTNLKGRARQRIMNVKHRLKMVNKTRVCHRRPLGKDSEQIDGTCQKST